MISPVLDCWIPRLGEGRWALGAGGTSFITGSFDALYGNKHSGNPAFEQSK